MLAPLLTGLLFWLGLACTLGARSCETAAAMLFLHLLAIASFAGAFHVLGIAG